MLGTEGHFILLVHMKGITLVFEEIEVGEPGFVVCKTNIVSVPFDGSDWCRAPQVSMDPQAWWPAPLPTPSPQASL